MRVLHVISGIDPINGGPAVAVRGLALAQAAAGLDVTVAASWVDKPGHETAGRLESGGVKVRLIGPCRDPMSRHPLMKRTMRQLVAQTDVVHIHAMWEEIQHQAARAARRLRVPYVMTPHGMLDPWNMSKNRWTKRLYLALRMRRNLDRASLIHFTTAIERDWVARWKFKAPTLVEPLGLDLAEFQTLPPGGTFRARYSIASDRPLVLFLGRLHAGKGLEWLVPAFAKIVGRIKPAPVLAIVGPDSDGFRAVVEEDVRRRGLGESVIFTGMLQGADRVAALTDADLLALPSCHENFGVAVVEALAAGTPVVISDQVNIHREIAAAGVGGVVPLDVEALAEELTRWLEDAELRRLAGEKARPFVRERYDWNQIALRWRDHYAHLLPVSP